MKLKKLGKKKHGKKHQSANTGEWTETREQFTHLKPLNLVELDESVMVAPKSHRPYLSRLAKAEGIDYFTVGISDDQMLVICYEVPSL